jgi:hypothetical protein
MYSYSNKIRFIGIILFSFSYRPISVDSMRAVFLFHILNDRKYEINWRRFQGNIWRHLNFKKKTELVQILRKCNEKISGNKDVGTYLKKPVICQWKKWAAIDSSIEACSLVLWKYIFGVICTKILQIQRKIC